jgi:hypothetical protein
MKEVVNTQLRLRRAFRYGYFAFVAIAAVLLALLALWTFSGDAVITLARSIVGSPIIFIVAVGLGLCVPLFFAAWLLISSAILGGRVQNLPLMDGVRD